MGDNLYHTDNFSVEYIPATGILKGTFLQCETSDAYINAMKVFKPFYDKILPRYTLWDNTAFTHIISPAENEWTNTFLNIPSWKKNVTRKVGIITSPDIVAMLSVSELFENGKAAFQPGFFAHEKLALDWLLQKDVTSYVPSPDQKLPLLNFIKDAETDTISVNLQFNATELSFYLKQFRQILQNRAFLQNHYHLFLLLTPQEKKVLEKIIAGHESRHIAENLFISIETVKSHRKNIFRKLKAQKHTDLLPFKLFL